MQIGENLDDPQCQTYCSSRVAQDTCLAAGVINDNAMHISEVTNVLQMRTSYKKLQEGKGEMIEQMLGRSIESKKEVAYTNKLHTHVCVWCMCIS